MKFRQALIAAAEEAHREGELTRPQLFAIRIGSLRPAVLAQAQQACEEEATSAGLAPAAGPGAFDWSSLLSFLKELLPIILMFFQRS